MTGKVGRAGADEQGRDYRVRPWLGWCRVVSQISRAPDRTAVQRMVLGRRSDLANPQLRLEEGEQVCVDHLRVSGAHAVRVPLVDLKCRVLNQLRRNQRRISDRHDLVVVAVHDQYRNFQVL